MAAENFKVKKGLEVGTGITANSDGINVTGVITATQYRGDGSGLTGVVASGTGVVVKDEGSAVGTAGTINFVGTGVAAAITGGTATVTINSGSSNVSVANQADNRLITATGTTDALNAESNLTLASNGIMTLNGQAIIDEVNINDNIVQTNTSNELVVRGKGVGGSHHLKLDDDVTIVGVSTFNDDVTFLGTSPSVSANKLFFDKSNNQLTFFDSTKANFGQSGDLQIYHQGAINYIDCTNTSQLLIQSDDLHIRNEAGNQEIITTAVNGAVKLYFAGNQKLTTTINGIEVPDLNVTGVGTVGRLDTSGVTLGTNATTFAAKFADDAVANFGTNNDLKISHNNTDAIFENTTGQFIFKDTAGEAEFKIQGHEGSSASLFLFADEGDDPDDRWKTTAHTDGNLVLNYYKASTSAYAKSAQFTNDGGAQLFHTGVKKFETTGQGVVVTGVCTATSFSGDGSGLTGITASGTGIVIQHDGSNVGTAGTINFSTNLDVSPVSAGIVTVTASGGGGGSQNLFSTIAISGQSNIVADGTTDTLTFAEGSNITLTTNAGTDTITIASEQRTVESIQDIVGNMFTSNTETDITATYQDADGTIDLVVDLSSLNADNLDSGEIPNGRFPTTLPAVSGANLTALNASQITSGTLPIARIEDNAVTFAKMQDVGTGVLIGRNGSGSGDMETLSASEVRTLLNVADGATAGGDDPTTSDIQVTYEITNQTSFSYYRFAGNGVDSSANNPDIYLERGQKYRFINNSGGTNHPFEIQTTGGSAYNTGVTNNGASTGSASKNIDFAVRWDAPAQLKYQCTNHGSMQGNIYIHGANGENTNVGITSFSGAVTAPSFSGSIAASNINTGTLDVDRIPGLAASKIISGTIGTSIVPNLPTSKITSGTFDAERIPTLNQNTTGTAAGLSGTPDITVDDLTVNGNTTLGNATSDTVTINAHPTIINDSGLKIYSSTNGAGAKINFSDQSSRQQNGTLTYKHGDGAVTTTGGNSNDGWLFEGTETRTVVKVVGDIEATSNLYVGNANISSGISTFTASAGTTVTADSTAIGSANVIEYTIYVSNSTNIQSQKVLIMDNGTTAYISEFSVMSNPNLIATFSADVNGGNVRLRATPETGISGSTTIKFTKMIIG